MAPHAVVFDAFGTLLLPVQRDGPYQRLIARASGDRKELRRAALTSGLQMRDFARRLGLECQDEEELLAIELASCARYQDAEVALNGLAGQGIPFAVCSNLAAGYAARLRELVPDANSYVLSCETGFAKPDPEIYLACAEALGVPVSRLLFVGDTPAMDVDGPRRAGMHAELVNHAAGLTVSAAIDRHFGSAPDRTDPSLRSQRT